MNRKAVPGSSSYIKGNKRRRAWHKVVQIMSGVVVFCTTYALILPAITLETPTSCGMEEHTHTESCYIQLLDQTTHEHTEQCYQIPEGHIHAEACYAQQRGSLICQEVTEHIHSDACRGSAAPVCANEEAEHVHDESCYEAACTLTEGHEHTNTCYEWSTVLACDQEEAQPVLVCTEGETSDLTCTLDHTHSALCYGKWELVCPKQEHAHSLICFSDPEADTETEKVWKRTLPDLTGVYVDDVLAAAESQLDYTESKNNYTVLDDGMTMKGYTRYGDWYGDPYGKWDGMFASFCLYYAGANELEALKDFPLEADAAEWVRLLQENEEEDTLFLNAEDGTPAAGDLVFFDRVEDELNEADHVAIVIGIAEAEDGTAFLRVYEGDCNDRVQENAYTLDDETIVGYGLLPEVPDYTPAEPAADLHTFSDDTVYVEVQLPEDTDVPEDAVLKVAPISAENESYAAYVAQAEAAVEGTVANIALYDISFYTADDDYIPVSDTADVTMGFVDSPVDAAANVQVLHFAEAEAAPAQLTDVTVEERELEMHLPDTQPAPIAEPEAEAVQFSLRTILSEARSIEPLSTEPETTTVTETRTVIEFTTDGFSTFAVIELTSMYQTFQGITGLENKSYIIAGVNVDGGNFNGDGTQKTLPVMTSDIITYQDRERTDLDNRQTNSFVYSDNKVTSVALTDYTNAVWTFEKAGTDTYYIKSSGGQYLSITNGKDSLTLSDDQQEFRVVAATNPNAVNGDATNAVCIETDINGATYRVNLVANGNNNSFTSWNSGINDRGNHLVLVEYIEPQPVVLTDLAGKSYIIVGVNNNTNNNSGVTKTNLPVLTGVTGTYTFDGDNARTVNVLNGNKQTTEDAAYVNNHVMAVALADTTKAVWTFEKADGYVDAYYIKNTTTNTYLNFTGEQYAENLTLSDQQQAIVVLKADGFDAGDDQNAIYLRTADAMENDKYYYVNLVGNGNTTYFFGYEYADKGSHLALIEYKEHDVTMPVISGDALNNLAGKKLVITNIRGYAITGTALNTDNEDALDDRLAAEKVTIANGQGAVTISNESSTGLVWEFEAVQGAGDNNVYYIKHVATGKYLHIYADPHEGDKPLTLTDGRQAILVYPSGDNTVAFAYPFSVNDAADVYNVIDYFGTRGFGVYDKDNPQDQNKFLLSEYIDLPMMDAFDPTAPLPVSDLNGKTMVITAAKYNAAMSSNDATIGGRGMLKAQETTEKNGILGVASDTDLADVKWKFESVPDGQENQYYISSNGQYLNISKFDDPNEPNSAQVTLSGTKQAISVYENNDGTFVFSATDDQGNEYLLDFGVNENAFSAWGRAHWDAQDNNKFKLTPVEQFDQGSKVVTNLDDMTLALISIYDANPKKEGVEGYTPKYALTSAANGTGLQGVEVELSGNNGEIYTFDDTKFTDKNELWTFQAVDNKLGVYYIKAANGQYLNLGDGSATVSDTKQEITVLSDTYVGNDGITYEVVYLRATVDGKEVYLRREDNGYDRKLFGDDNLADNDTRISQRNFVLAQPYTIKIDVYKYLNPDTDDWLYKPQFDNQGTTLKEEYIGGEGKLPTSGELGAEPEENTRTIKTQHFVSFCFQESWDAYTAGKGRDFPQAYMASWAPALDANKNGYIDLTERGDTNGDGKVNGDDDPAAKAKFIQTLKDAVYDPDNFTGESPYWGVEYELTHYEVTLPDGSTLKDGDDVVKFAPGTSYEPNAEGTAVVIKDVNGVERTIPSGSTFKAQYREFSDILTFYINLYGVVEDTSGNIQPRYIEDFTLGLAIAHIYNPGQYAGDTDEDYTKTNEYINSLFKGAYGENIDRNVMHAVIDGFITRNAPENRGAALNDPNKQRILSNEMTHALGASATALAAHVLDYVRTVSDIDIMLKNYVAGNSEETPALNNQTIDTATFEVRWYVVKDQGDSWHIDGVTIGKTEPIPVTKAFYGLDKDEEGNESELVTKKMNYERTGEVTGETDYTDTPNYQIGVSIYSNAKSYIPYYNMQPYDQEDWDKTFTYGDNKTCKDPNLNPAIDKLYSYNGGENPYNWTMSAILQQSYELTEQNYIFEGYDRVSKVTVKNKDGTSVDSVGVKANVTGGTTASVEFKNYYTKENTGMFIVKKVSSVTGLPLAGAGFTLYDSSNNALYTEYTDADGETAFYNLQPGTYTLKETKAPDGFTVTQSEWTIKVDADGKVTCDNQELYPVKVEEVDNAVTITPLEIKNAPSTTTVKVIKQFVGISKDQVDSLAENYSIVMQPTDNGNTYTLKLSADGNATPVVSADGLTYTWTLTNVPEIGYTVTESKFKLKNYVTTVSVEGFKDGDYTTSVTDPVVANDTATFTATFNEDHEDGFTIYNSYANDFSMQITKVDSTDNKPLSGATFEVYGAHHIATDPRNVVVAGQTLYYLGEVTTDTNGMATFDGWEDENKVFHKLVLGYPYALVETKAPDGYNLLKEPIYLGVVKPEGVEDLDKEANPNLVFSNGVYTITVANQPGYKLPESGGTGTYLYTIGGLMLMMAAAILLYSKTKRGKEELASS